MIKREKSMVIHRPIEEVFDYVGDQRNTPQWQSGLVEVRRTTEGPPGIGTKHTFVRKFFLGRKMEASNEYVAYEPGKRITFKTTSGPVRLEASYLFEPTAEGTKLTSRVEMQAVGLFALAEPLIAAGLNREMDEAFIDLKHLLESSDLARAVTVPLHARTGDVIDSGDLALPVVARAAIPVVRELLSFWIRFRAPRQARV